MKLCVIPARGGSKRIPKKNIRNFCGKPIIAWSIETVIRAGCFDKIIVSTDDNEIADVAKQFGAEIPFLRPKEISDDKTGTNTVVRHALQYYKTLNKHFQYACCVYATAPFLEKKYLIQGEKIIKQPEVDYAVSITSFPYPVQRALIRDKKELLSMLDPKFTEARSQDLIETYHDAGQIYWGKVKSFNENIPLFSGNTAPIYIPRSNVQDIDTIEDWDCAELMFKAFKNHRSIY